MHFTTHDQLVLVALLGVLGVLLIAAPVLRIPYPILLVLGGLALGFVPGMPRLALPHEQDPHGPVAHQQRHGQHGDETAAGRPGKPVLPVRVIFDR